jgi:ribonuclease R
VPTSTLRHWLREAGVRVGADGTLTGSADPAPPGVTSEDHAGDKPDAAAGQGTSPAAGRPQPAPLAIGGSPVQTLNELAQAGYVAGLAWETGAEGAGHQPLFTCTVTATATGIAGWVRARGTGGSKAAAKASAAAALLAALADDDPVTEDAPRRGE